MVDDPDAVAEMDTGPIDAHPVDEAAVRAGEIDQRDVAAREFQHGVFAADLVVIEHDVVRVEPPDIEDRVGGNLVNDLIIQSEVGRSNRASLAAIGLFHNRSFSVYLKSLDAVESRQGTRIQDMLTICRKRLPGDGDL